MLTLIQINPACGISHLVAWPAVPDLFICAKHLLFAAMRATNSYQDRRASNLLFGGAAWRHARGNLTRAPSGPQPLWARKTHWQVQCIVWPIPCSRSKLTWLFGSMAASQGQPAASFDFAQPQHANVPCTRRVI